MDDSGSGSSTESDNNQELRKRQIEEVFDEKEPEIEIESEEENDLVSEDSEKDEIIKTKPETIPCPPPRNIQSLNRPSFISRQFGNVKNFFIELFEFILLL